MREENLLPWWCLLVHKKSMKCSIYLGHWEGIFHWSRPIRPACCRKWDRFQIMADLHNGIISVLISWLLDHSLIPRPNILLPYSLGMRPNHMALTLACSRFSFIQPQLVVVSQSVSFTILKSHSQTWTWEWDSRTLLSQVQCCEWQARVRGCDPVAKLKIVKKFFLAHLLVICKNLYSQRFLVVLYQAKKS